MPAKAGITGKRGSVITRWLFTRDATGTGILLQVGIGTHREPHCVQVTQAEALHAIETLSRYVRQDQERK